MDFTVQMSARDEYRLLDITEATERRVSVRDSDEDLRPHLALVVDDTPDIIRLVHNSLRTHFKVISAEDGLKGLEMAVREQPSLVVADLMMPGIDGLELTRRLRSDDRTRHIPVLMLTARGDLDDRVKGLETGVSAYLAKPFSPRELLTTARALVQAQATTADIVLTQRMDSLEIVAGGLAHEINNPLNYLKNALARIRLDAQTLVDGKTDDVPRLAARMRELFDIAESGIKRIGIRGRCAPTTCTPPCATWWRWCCPPRAARCTSRRSSRAAAWWNASPRSSTRSSATWCRTPSRRRPTRAAGCACAGTATAMRWS
jgi:DNA-binding response OmpR family regulator